MADDVTLPGTGQVVETRQQTDNSHRQVVAVESGELVDSLHALISVLQNISKSIGLSMPDALGRQRILLDAISASLTLGTVSTITTLSNMAGAGTVAGAVVSTNDYIPSQMNTLTAQLRNRIVIS
jgi:hypothetical protein